MTAHLSGLFARDLKRLSQELAAYPDDDSLWRALPGITNPAGSLVLHLEGNLRDFVGSKMAGIPYERRRDLEFGTRGLTQADIAGRVTALAAWLPGAVAALTPADLERPFPQLVWEMQLSTGQFLLHLYGHLNYHIGQIAYLRRALTGQGAVKHAALQ